MMFYLSIIVPLLAMVFAFLGIGLLSFYILKRQGVSLNLHPVMRLLLAYFLGQGLLGCFLLLIGVAGKFHNVVIMPVIILLGVLGLFLFLKNIKFYFALFRAEYRQLRSDSWWWFILLPACLAVVVLDFWALAAHFDSDSLAFYWALAKVTAFGGSLVPLPGYENFTSITVNGEMLTAALMNMGMPSLTPRLLPWINMFPLLAMAYALAVLYAGNRRFALLFVIFICSSTAMIVLQNGGRADAPAFGQGLAALACLYYALKSSEPGKSRLFLFVLAGFYVGFAFSFKMAYAVYMIPWVTALTIGYVFWLRPGNLNLIGTSRKNDFKIAFFTLLLIGVGVLLATIPHLIKNYALYDNILGPTVQGMTSPKWFSTSTMFRLLLSYPLALVYGDYWAQLGNISSLLLGLVPFIFLVSRKKWGEYKPLLLLFGAALCALLIWLIYAPSVFQMRYTLLLFIALGLPGLLAAALVSQNSKLVSCLLPALALAALFVGYYPTIKSNDWINIAATNDYLVNQYDETPTNILSSMSATHFAVNERAKHGERVYVMAYRFWLRPDLLLNARKDTENASLENGNQFWEYLRGHNFTFVINDFSIQITEEFFENPPDYVQLELIYETPGYAAYHVRYLR